MSLVMAFPGLSVVVGILSMGSLAYLIIELREHCKNTEYQKALEELDREFPGSRDD